MALLQNELFVINPVTFEGKILDRTTLKLKRDGKLSNFYSISRNSLCSNVKYVYVSTTSNMILKLDSDGDIVAKWSTGDIKGRPSLTADCNVAFIPHDNTTRIFIYTPYGDLIRIIQVNVNIHGARLNCAVDIPNGDFVISYGTESDTQHGLLLVDSDGYVLRWFGGEKGSGKYKVNGAYDLAVDKLKNVVVVDHNNHRVFRLNSDLRHLHEILSYGSGTWFPYGVLLDDLHFRLFVMGSTVDKERVRLSTRSFLSYGKIIVYAVQ